MNGPDTRLETLAKRRVRARNDFVVHLLMYVLGNVGLIIIWALTGRGYPWFMWVVLGWGVAIAAHAVTLFIGPDTAREQRAIQREMDRMRPTHHPR